MTFKVLLPAVAGSAAASAVLAAQHIGLNRAGLRRVDAYVAGTLGLDLGYWITQLVAGRSPYLWELAFIQMAGGSTVKGLYWLDRKLLKDARPGDVQGQLKETLGENEALREGVTRLKAELKEALDLPGVRSQQLEEWLLNLFASAEDVKRVLGVIESLKGRVRDRLPEIRRAEATEYNRIHKIDKARSARKQKAGYEPASGLMS